MADFFIKYWLEFAFGLVAALVTFLIKKFYALFKKDLENQKKELSDQIIKVMDEKIQVNTNESQKADDKIKEDIEELRSSVQIITKGLLAIQGKGFHYECITLLEQPTITVMDYEQFEEDYAAYKSLGGNHRGDTLHDRVVEKYTAQITSQKNINN